MCGNKDAGFITTTFRRFPFTKWHSWHLLIGYVRKPKFFIGINHRGYLSIFLIFLEIEASYSTGSAIKDHIVKSEEA